MPGLYSQDPIVSHNLRKFNARCNTYHKRKDDDAFIRCALTGQYHDNDEPKQVFIDVHRSRLPSSHPINVKRDIDSALGISPDILTGCDIDYHKLPNFEFGTFGTRHAIIFVFPRLWTRERTSRSQSYMTERERAFWYERGLRPALEEISFMYASEWPATYETEVIRAQKQNGQHAWTSKMLPAKYIHGLTDRIRQQFSQNPMNDPEDVAWASDFFVLHIIRGVKHATSHDLTFDDAYSHLDLLFTDSQLAEDAGTRGEWWIDIGLELQSAEGMCLQWTTSAHCHIVQQALQISENHAKRITKITSSKYTRDYASHLTEISGFHITPGTRAQGPFEAAYVQAYTTDKSVVYNTDGSHHAKFLTSKDALGPKQPSKLIKGIYTIYDKARKKNPSHARLEVRVPYKHATDVLLDVDLDILRDCVYAFHIRDWWNFRIIHITACSQTFDLQESATALLRFMPESLLLTAACIWLVNGLHARPEDGPASRDLMSAVLPVAEADDVDQDVLAYNTCVRPPWQHEDEESGSDREPVARVPINPFGCVFLRRIKVKSVEAPRVRFGGPDMSFSSFKFWFDGFSIEQVKAKYQRSGIVDSAVVARVRSTLNKHHTTEYFSLMGELEPHLFSLSIQGYTLPPIDLHAGSDTEDRQSPQPLEDNIDKVMSDIWRQFVKDTMSKSPNMKGITNPSYLRLTDVQRSSANEDPFRHLRLSEVFRAVYYKNGNENQWQLAFNWLFPDIGFKTTRKTQTYHTCTYFKQWMHIIETNAKNPKLITAMRNAFWKRLREWSWVPHTGSDRMWNTSANKPSGSPYTRWPPSETRAPAPLILLKGGTTPSFPHVDEDSNLETSQSDHESNGA
ncbi:hypothetical protein AN958_12781 [Leucoagaricus sp. SymC.cos]|nr:hypothetical protein AN958_12781 [Leucoagaricus sp. SymC.cos]